MNEFTPKLNDDGDAYLFSVPLSGASQSLHIVTPSYFDGSIELAVQTLSQGVLVTRQRVLLLPRR